MTYRKISELPVGTKFRVYNGVWDGEIIEINGIKHIHVGLHDDYSKHNYDLTLTENKDRELDIGIIQEDGTHDDDMHDPEGISHWD